MINESSDNATLQNEPSQEAALPNEPLDNAALRNQPSDKAVLPNVTWKTYMWSVALLFVSSIAFGNLDDSTQLVNEYAALQKWPSCGLANFFLHEIERGYTDVFHIAIIPVYILIVALAPFGKPDENNSRIITVAGFFTGVAISLYLAAILIYILVQLALILPYVAAVCLFVIFLAVVVFILKDLGGSGPLVDATEPESNKTITANRHEINWSSARTRLTLLGFAILSSLALIVFNQQMESRVKYAALSNSGCPDNELPKWLTLPAPDHIRTPAQAPAESHQ